MRLLGKMKSALEIALEKAKKLNTDGKTTKTTLDEIEQKKYVQVAASLGNSFLQGKVKIEEIEESILRYPERYRKAAIASFIKQITGEMNFENTPEILQAISNIIEDDAGINACKEAEKLFYQYMEQLKERFSRLQENTTILLRKELEGEGIRGSAIADCNIRNLKEWQDTSAQLQKEYGAIIENFRSAVLKGE
jgi:hypothetical protein